MRPARWVYGLGTIVRRGRLGLPRRIGRAHLFRGSALVSACGSMMRTGDEPTHETAPHAEYPCATCSKRKR